MNLDKICIALRPRNKNEAIDLGFLMAKRWYWPLLSIWLALTLPIVIIVTTIFNEYIYWLGLGLWWCLPFLERPLCFYLSQAVFGQQPTLKSIFTKLPSLFSRHFFSWLTYKRFYISRSVLCPIIILEKLDGRHYNNRKQILLRNDSGSAQWLAMVCAHLVGGITYGLVTLLYFIKPTSIPQDWEHIDLSDINVVEQLQSVASYLENTNLLITLCYYGALSLITPFFVAGGFSLYLNQRTRLEGWDIDLQFKRILTSNKIKNLAVVSLVTVGFCFNLDVQAEQPARTEQSQQVRAEVQSILKELEHDEVSKTGWRLKEFNPNLELSDKTNSTPKLSGNIDTFRFLVWLIGGGVLAFLLYHFIGFLSHHNIKRIRKHKPANNYSTDEGVLPKPQRQLRFQDVLQAYDDQQMRDVVVYLWLLLLEQLRNQHQLPLEPSMTEFECLKIIDDTLQHRSIVNLVQRLVKVKQAICYAGDKVDWQDLKALIDAYQSNMQVNQA